MRRGDDSVRSWIEAGRFLAALLSGLTAACATVQVPAPATLEVTDEIPALLGPQEGVAAARREADPARAFERAWLEGNDRAFARQALERGLAATPGSPELLLRRGLLSLFELDRPSAQRDFLALIEGAPSTDEGEAAAILLAGNLEAGSPDEKEIERRLLAAIAARPGRATTAVFATLALARIQGPAEDPGPWRESGGWLTTFSAKGPLAAPVESSLREVSPAEKDGPEVEARWRGLLVPLRKIMSRTPDLPLELGGIDGLYVAESWVRIEPARAGAAVLTAFLASSSRIRIDGELLIDRNGDPALLPAVHQVRVPLGAGWHRITLATLAGGRAEPKLSLLGADGQPIVSESSATAPDGVRQAKGPGAASSLELGLLQQIKASLLTPRGAFGRALGAHLCMLDFYRDLECARSLLLPLAGAAPKSSMVALLESRLRALTGQPTSLLQARLRLALKTDPQNAALLYGLASSLDESDRDDALRMTELAIAAAPHLLPPELLRFKLLSDRRWNAEARQSLKVALEKGPGANTIASFARYLAGLSYVPEARALEQRLKERGPKDRAAAAINEALRGGELDRAVAELTELSRWSARPRAELNRIAELELGRGRIAAAKGAIAKALAEDPWDGRALALDATARRLSGDSKGALAALTLLSALGEADFDLESTAADLAGRAIGEANAGSWLGKVIGMDAVAMAKKPTDPRFMDAQQVRMLERTVDWVQADGRVLTLHQSLLRLSTKEATDAAGEFRLPGAALPLALRTLKPDGRTLEVDQHEGKADLSFSGLAPGDTVEKRWLSMGSPRSVFGGYLRTQFFQTDVPSELTELLVVVPKGLPVWWHAYHGAPEPEVHEEDGQTIYRFKAGPVAGIPIEPGAAPYEEFLPFVAVAVGLPLPASLEANAGNLQSSRGATWEVRALARRLTRDAVEPAEKLARLASWINGHIRAGGEPSPSLALATRRGNRTTLLVAMARAVGIPAKLVLARPGTAAIVDPPYPDPGRFGALLGRFELAQKQGPAMVQWSSDTEGAVWLGAAPPEMRRGSYLLPSADRAPEVVSFLPQEVERWSLSSKVELEVASNGDARGTVSLFLPGRIALGIRSGLRPLRLEDRRRALEGWLSSVIPGAHLLELAVEGLDEEVSPVSITCKLEAASFLTRDPERLVSHRFLGEPIGLFALGSRPLEAYLRLSQRKMPLSLPEAAERMEVTLSFPKEFRAPTDAPQSFAKDTPFGRFAQQFSWDAARNTAKLVVERDMPANRVSVAEFQGFRALLQEVALRSRNQLVLPVAKTGAPL